jgi:hypothetical protein
MTTEYEAKIMAKDENFFIHADMTELANTQGFDIDIISRLKSIWGTLNESDKEAIWKYIQLLVLLNKKCCQV